MLVMNYSWPPVWYSWKLFGVDSGVIHLNTAVVFWRELAPFLEEGEMEWLLREEIGELKTDLLPFISKYFQLRKTVVLKRERNC